MVKVTALKKRYVAFEVRSSQAFDENSLKHALYAEALRFFGEFGLSKVALKLLEYDGKIAVIRCSRDSYTEVLGWLALVNELNGRPARTVARAGSGTLAALKRRLG